MDLCSLPAEILERIFGYVDTADVLNLRLVDSRFADIATFRSVMRNVKLNNCYPLTRDDLLFYLAKKPICLNITTFNITSTYWIVASDLRRSIGHMINLEKLYVVDTKLGLLKLDVQLYRSLPKLKRLGVTVLKKTLCMDVVHEIPPLTHLYLHIHSSVSPILRSFLYAICKYDVLQELWLVEIGLPVVFELWLPRIPADVSSLTIAAMNIAFQCDSLRLHNLSKFFMSNGANQQSVYRRVFQKPTYLCSRHISDVNWSYLFKLFRTSSPFSPKQYEEIFYDDRKLTTIEFDEINIIHPAIRCTDVYLLHIENLLLYDNMRHLQKLGLNYCSCLMDPTLVMKHNVKTAKQKVPAALEDTSLLCKISKRLTNIEELEIWTCHRVTNLSVLFITNGSLGNIGNFKKLTKLTLENIPRIISGSFFTEIFSQCLQLASLRIQSQEHNAILHNMLCNALQVANNLKDLRYEHNCFISIDRLFEALGPSSPVKLHRLFVKCHMIEVFSEAPFKNFLAANPQLMFLYIVIKDLPKPAIRTIKTTMEKYKTDPRKIFVITKSEEQYEATANVPHIHIDEMIKLSPRIGTYNVFTDFAS